MFVVHKLIALLTWSELDQLSTLLSECLLLLSLFCSYVKRLIGTTLIQDTRRKHVRYCIIYIYICMN